MTSAAVWKLQERCWMLLFHHCGCCLQMVQVCESMEAAGGSWLGLRDAHSLPRMFCREQEGGMLRTAVMGLSVAHAQSSQPKALLKQRQCFRGTCKGKFPKSTVCEATGPQGKRNLSPRRGSVMLRMLFLRITVGSWLCSPSPTTSSHTYACAEMSLQAPFLIHLLSFIFK